MTVEQAQLRCRIAGDRAALHKLLRKALEHHLAQFCIDEHLVALGIPSARKQVAGMDAAAIEVAFALQRQEFPCSGLVRDQIYLRARHRRVSQSALVFRGEIDLVTRSEEHTSELQSLMRISYAVFCLKTNKTNIITYPTQL